MFQNNKKVDSDISDTSTSDRRAFLQGSLASLAGVAFSSATPQLPAAEVSVIPLPGYFRAPRIERANTFPFNLATVEGFGSKAREWLSAENVQKVTPQICRVDNFHDSGPGSLRHALETVQGPRIVLFEVGGRITPKSPLRIPPGEEGGCVWIAGQSAPSPGILVDSQKGACLSIENGDVLVQHVLFRGGKTTVRVGQPVTRVGTAQPVSNIVLDYCSIGPSLPSGTALKIDGATDVTVQRSFIAGDYTRGLWLPPSDRGGSDRTGVDIVNSNKVTLWSNFIINTDRVIRFQASPGRDVLELVGVMGYHFSSSKDAMINIIVPEGVHARVRVSGCCMRPLPPSRVFDWSHLDQFIDKDKHRYMVHYSGKGTEAPGQLSLLARSNAVVWQEDRALAEDAPTLSIFDETLGDARCAGSSAMFSARIVSDDARAGSALIYPYGAFTNSEPRDPLCKRLWAEADCHLSRIYSNTRNVDAVYSRMRPQMRRLDVPERPFTAADSAQGVTAIEQWLTDVSRFPVINIGNTVVRRDSKAKRIILDETWKPSAEVPLQQSARPGGQ